MLSLYVAESVIVHLDIFGSTVFRNYFVNQPNLLFPIRFGGVHRPVLDEDSFRIRLTCNGLDFHKLSIPSNSLQNNISEAIPIALREPITTLSGTSKKSRPK